MLWQKITLTKSQIDSGAVQRVRKDFERAYKDAGLPTDASVFVSKRTDPVGDIEIYFSPRAGNIAQGLIDSFAGVPCNAPPASEVEEIAMKKLPGHEKWPNHKIKEERFAQKVKVEVAGEIVAESSNVIRVKEDEHPDRYYLPRSDVKMDKLERTSTTTDCPFKGTAHYFSLKTGNKEYKDAVWSYEDPYEEHRDLKDRLAFYDDKIREIRIHAEPEAA